MIPKISVIIPCYNSERYLDTTLRSVSNQTYSNWQCIIINDGSTDNTEEIALSWCNKDFRFSYFFKKNGGLSDARNCGLDKASGNYIQFLDSDDYIDKEKFEKSLNALKQAGAEKNVVVISNFRIFRTTIEDFESPYCSLDKDYFNFRDVLLQWPVKSIPIHCGLIYKGFFETFRFPSELRSAEDWVMWLYVFKNGMVPIFLDEPLAYYRKHSHSLTTNFEDMDRNLQRAIKHIKNIIPIEDYIYSSYKNHQEMYLKIHLLHSRLEGIENSNTYVFSERLKKSLIGRILVRIMRKLIEGN